MRFFFKTECRTDRFRIRKTRRAEDDDCTAGFLHIVSLERDPVRGCSSSSLRRSRGKRDGLARFFSRSSLMPSSRPSASHLHLSFSTLLRPSSRGPLRALGSSFFFHRRAARPSSIPFSLSNRLRDSLTLFFLLPTRKHASSAALDPDRPCASDGCGVITENRGAFG